MSLGSDYLRSLLEEDPERGVYRCKREMFTDPRLFELEMKHIFEGNWVYLAHESQVAGINDYLTTQIGRQSIVIARNRDGQLNAFINACSHRGAMLCRHKSGNRSSYTCPFHGWTFNNSGKLLKVKDPAEAGYPQGFNCEGSHDLTRVARFESYRGFLFGSLNPDVRPLAEHLGESAKIIDMIVDQSPEGLEVLRGSSSYVYEGNWKLTAENGADGYHVSSVHWNYAATQSQRQQRDAADQPRTMSAAGWARQGGGFYSFEHGHMLLWSRWANPEDQLGLRAPRRACPRLRRGPRRLDDRELAQPLPVPQRLPDGPVQLADPHRPYRCRWTARKSPSTASRRKARAPRRAPGASASTRTSSTSAAWPPRTTWRSSVPASRATRAAWSAGTTCRAAPNTG